MNNLGFLLLNKPKGISTFKVLYPVKRFFKGHKVGHAGTLDPDAHGLVIAAVGKATRLLSFLEAENKCYEFMLHVGTETDSYDAEGAITVRYDNAEVTGNAVAQQCSKFKGEIDQIPPVYSAIKIDGKRACDRVRKGESVEIKSRKVTILSLELLDADTTTLKNDFRIRCHCSKGTYIRSLGFDLGKALGSGAYVSDIKRVSIGSCHLDDAVDVESVDLDAHLLSPERLIPYVQSVVLSDQWLTLLKNGIKIEFEKLQSDELVFKPREKYFILDSRGQLHMYAETDAELLRPKVQLYHDE